MKKTSFSVSVTSLLLMTTTALVILGWSTPSDADSTGDELVVVVNKSNPAKSMSREELRPVFQTTKTQWQDGVRAEPVNLADESPVRQSFDLAILGLEPDRAARYWVDRKIRGGERPPRKLTTSSAVIRSVANERGGVGYVPAKDLNDTVRVVARVKNGQVVAP